MRQLVSDLGVAGLELGPRRFRELFRSLWAKFRGVELDGFDLDLDPLKFSFTLEATLDRDGPGGVVGSIERAAEGSPDVDFLHGLDGLGPFDSFSPGIGTLT